MGKYITSKQFNTYERTILGLIDDGGTYVTVNLEDVESKCGNCRWDAVHKTSSGMYNGSGPKPFTGICPVCGGKGTVTSPRKIDVKCLVNWGSAETSERKRTSAGEKDTTVFKLKAPVAAYDLFKAAKSVVADGIKATPQAPTKRGLGGDVVTEMICFKDP